MAASSGLDQPLQRWPAVIGARKKVVATQVAKCPTQVVGTGAYVHKALIMTARVVREAHRSAVRCEAG